MIKTFALAALVSASVLVSAIPTQAREISVWGNTFTTDDTPAVASPAAMTRLNAIVEHPELYSRGTRRLHHTTR